MAQLLGVAATAAGAGVAVFLHFDPGFGGGDGELLCGDPLLDLGLSLDDAKRLDERGGGGGSVGRAAGSK